MKIARMMRAVEQLQTWLEFATYQLTVMTHKEANTMLGDYTALIKVPGPRGIASTRTALVAHGLLLFVPN